MPTSTFSIDSLISNCNNAFPSAGTWGCMTLLKGDLTTGLSYTANAATNTLATPSAHGLVTGSRVRLVGGTLPTPLLANTDYFTIASTPATLTLSATLGGAAIDLADAGSGALTLSEQALTAADPLAVLINKEISHPSWPTRAMIDNLGAATAVSGVAEKPQKTVAVTNTGATTLSYQHYLFIQGGASTLGSIAGTGFILNTAATIQNIAAGDPPRAIFFKLRAGNI
jgi:hypothetical protein